MMMMMRELKSKQVPKRKCAALAKLRNISPVTTYRKADEEFEEAEKSGNIISLIDDEDEPDGNKSTASNKVEEMEVYLPVKKLKLRAADSQAIAKMMTTMMTTTTPPAAALEEGSSGTSS